MSFIIYFDVCYMELSWSHDLSCEFDKLTRVDPDQSNMLLF
jgi:hypothetical protein